MSRNLAPLLMMRKQRNKMYDTTVKMKDGRVFCGPIWNWAPTEGWFSLIGIITAPNKIMFDEVESAITKNVQLDIGTTEDIDELARAKRQMNDK